MKPVPVALKSHPVTLNCPTPDCTWATTSGQVFDAGGKDLVGEVDVGGVVEVEGYDVGCPVPVSVGFDGSLAGGEAFVLLHPARRRPSRDVPAAVRRKDLVEELLIRH